MAITVNSSVRYKHNTGAIVEEQSHTGDTAVTTIGTIVVPANSMGLYGFCRVSAAFFGVGAGVHYFYVYFGGTLVKFTYYTGNNIQVDWPLIYIWNKNVTNAQGHTLKNGIQHARYDTLLATALDTTADVDIDFKVMNSVAGDTSYLRFASVESFRFDDCQ